MMSRCLSEELIKYQKQEEKAIMDIAKDMDEAGKELVRKFYEPLVGIISHNSWRLFIINAFFVTSENHIRRSQSRLQSLGY